MVSWDDAHIAHRIIIWAYAEFRSLASGCKTPLPFFLCVPHMTTVTKNILAKTVFSVRCVYPKEKASFGKVVLQECR